MNRAEQVSEEVERALAKLGPARISGRYELSFCFVFMKHKFGIIGY